MPSHYHALFILFPPLPFFTVKSSNPFHHFSRPSSNATMPSQILPKWKWYLSPPNTYSMLLYLFCSTEPFQLYISVVICHGLPVERIHAMRSYTQYMSMPNTQTNICRIFHKQTWRLDLDSVINFQPWTRIFWPNWYYSSLTKGEIGTRSTVLSNQWSH